jgi:4-cresol dehydrogenase (hydroxylating) flavoprotein subunit
MSQPVSDPVSRTVPEGTTPEALDAAIAQLTEELGERKVLTGEADLREFRDPFQHASSDAFVASAIVMPTTVEEIQAIVRIANEHGVPLWTHGQGRNNGYGGPAPRVAGSVVVSLRNMNRVLELNEELGYAVVEPGVRWFDLYEAIRDQGADLMLSIADVGWGSVVGNTLEHGGTYLPYGLDFQMQCGMEVVLADATVMRTGMGAMPGNRSWHCYKRGLGPTPDQLFMQSNYGIVTKMGVWLMPKPEIYMPCWLTVPRDDDIAPLIDTLRELMLDGSIRMVPQIMNTLLLGAVTSDRPTWYSGPGAMPDDAIDAMAAGLDVGRWTMRFALYDDEPVVDHRFARIKRAFETAIPGAKVWGTKHDPAEIPDLEHPAERIQGGVPSLDWNHMTGWYGGEEGGHIGFSPIAPMTGRDALAVRDLMRSMLDEAGLDYIAGLSTLSARSFVHVTMVIFDTKDAAQVEAAYAVCRRLVVEAAARGYGEYRAHLDFMDLATDQYSFGDHAYRRFTETIKDALDPNGILSPGKQGIWPARLRPARQANGADGNLPA